MSGWKVCRSCFSAARYDEDDFTCLACGGNLQHTPLVPKHVEAMWPPELWEMAIAVYGT